jgi:hypothetical protein
VDAPDAASARMMIAFPLAEAWKMLLETKVLHAGMTVGEAVQVLGKPTFERKDRLHWQVSRRSRAAPPRLSAGVRDGLMVDWKVSPR